MTPDWYLFTFRTAGIPPLESMENWEWGNTQKNLTNTQRVIIIWWVIIDDVIIDDSVFPRESIRLSGSWSARSFGLFCSTDSIVAVDCSVSASVVVGRNRTSTKYRLKDCVHSSRYRCCIRLIRYNCSKRNKSHLGSPSPLSSLNSLRNLQMNIVNHGLGGSSDGLGGGGVGGVGGPIPGLSLSSQRGNNYLSSLSNKNGSDQNIQEFSMQDADFPALGE